MDLPEHEKVDKIFDLYRSLNDEEKDTLVAHIVQEEDLLSRLLNHLIEHNTDAESDFSENTSFVDFLRRVRE